MGQFPRRGLIRSWPFLMVGLRAGFSQRRYPLNVIVGSLLEYALPQVHLAHRQYDEFFPDIRKRGSHERSGIPTVLWREDQETIRLSCHVYRVSKNWNTIRCRTCPEKPQLIAGGALSFRDHTPTTTSSLFRRSKMLSLCILSDLR